MTPEEKYARLLADEATRQREIAERKILAQPANVLALFDAGATVEEVAELTELHPIDLRRLLMLREAQALPVAQRVQVERIEELLSTAMRARTPLEVRQAVTLMQREAELLGLDAPRKSEVDMRTTKKEQTNFEEYTTDELRAFVEYKRRRAEIDVTPRAEIPANTKGNMKGSGHA